MARKKRDFVRVVLPDVKYGDVLVTRTINVIMKQGKRGVAEKALYGALAEVQEKTGEEAVKALHKALENCRPIVEVRSRRVGGANYQVPTEVNPRRAQSLSIRWLVSAADERGERGIAQRLAAEIIDAINNRGGAVKKREDTHRMAEANKAFAHFKW